jgi:hypothetical protein
MSTQEHSFEARISRIVSGGQTGVDRAALDFALRKGIDHGGWVPKGRKAEDGPLPDRYRMVETKSSTYAPRTKKNVLDSDGTLIVYEGGLSGGTALTESLAHRAGKPVLAVDLKTTGADDAARMIGEWIVRWGISVLNVAGPRASQNPGIYDRTMELLEKVFASCLRVL